MFRDDFNSEGFLFIDQLIPASEVKEALKTIQEMSANEYPPKLLSRQDIATHPKVLKVLEHENIFKLINNLLPRSFNENTTLPIINNKYPSIYPIPYKWLRAVPNGLFTGPHFDSYYLGNGSKNLITVWIPLTEVSIEMGSMQVIPRSHKNEKFNHLRDRKHTKDNDGTKDGWIDQELLIGEEWVTKHFLQGDVCVLDINTLHKTCPNSTLNLRISCDTRWQPRSDKT